MLEDERFPLLVTQCLEGLVYVLSNLRPFRSLFGAIPGRPYGRAGVERNFSFPPALQLILAQVDGNSKQPPPDAFRIPTSIQAPISLDERLLDDVCCVVGPSRHPLRVSVERILVAPNEQSIRILVAGKYIPDDLRVAQLIARNPAFRPDPRDVFFSTDKTTFDHGGSLRD